MLANELIDQLERLGLLDQEIIEALREQLEQGGARVTPEAVAKLLVDNGQLTHYQATKLIGELRSGQYKETAVAEENDLTAGLDEIDTAEPVEVVEIDETPDVFAAQPVEVVATPVDAAVATGDSFGAAPPTDRPRPARKKPEPTKTVWDSFKVYGYLGIIALLVLAGVFFVFVLSREDADAYIADANKLYEQQNYTAAQERYLSFLDGFGEDHQYSSLARSRVTMTELYKAAQFQQEPWQAVDLAKEKLPVIAEEEGLNEDRGNLAALLVEIAANVARAAGRAQETTEKQDLLAKLDEQRELMENPMYMPTSFRSTLAGQIKGVEEARARVQRDINRNIRLDESEAAMKKSLDEKDTKAAYDTRFELLRDFPELRDHKRLVTLIDSASDIQQTLVKASTKLPTTVTEAAASDTIDSIALTTLSGRSSLDLQGETLYLRAGGSVLAFDGETGKLRWRKFVGYADDLPPVRVESGAGVLLSESASLEVLRCGADDGTVAWRALIEEEFSRPVSVGGDVFVSTQSGRLVCLDVETGDAKWATQIPQPLEVGPGVDDRADRVYLPGNHSNLYLLNARDGSSLESLYLGHQPGTISVAPVPLLGHLFVIENAGSDYANVHVLRVDDDGTNMRVAQPPFRLTGNVRVNPVIQGRRLIVLTDRGEVVVYDIEPTAEREQVTVAATLPAFYDQPTATQMAVGRTAMWITGTRIGRYELQINTGRVVRDWSLHELDTFIGEPIATDDTLVHARVLRGTSAIRVTAANPKTGEEIWRTDVGVPVATLRPAPGGKGFHAINSQAALFELDREALDTGSTTGPIENPGEKAVAIRFAHPIAVDADRSLMVDQAGGQSLAVYDPMREREKLRLVTMQLPAGKPAGEAIFAGGGVFMPLDTGRAVLIDYRTGAVVTTFQPASDPVGNVAWTTAVPLPDDPGQVIVADSRNKIYRLRVAEQIRELASRDLEQPFLGTLAGVGQTCFGTTSGPAADFLISIEMASLAEKSKSLLDGRVTWGPVAAGDLCLLETDDNQLRAFGEDATQKFQIELPAGPPVGQPIQVGDSIVLVGQTGWVIALNPTTGEVVGQSDLGQPISATPLAIGNRLLVPGAEGVVYITGVPGS